MSSIHLTTNNRRWRLPGDGREVSQYRVDYGVTLRLDRPAGTVEIRVEQTLDIVAANGPACIIRPTKTRQHGPVPAVRLTWSGS
jgi:hypothetical protein